MPFEDLILPAFFADEGDEVVTLTMLARSNFGSYQGYRNSGGVTYGSLAPASFTIGSNTYTIRQFRIGGIGGVDLVIGFDSTAQRTAFKSANLYIDDGTGKSVFRSGTGITQTWGGGPVLQFVNRRPGYVEGRTYTIHISLVPLT